MIELGAFVSRREGVGDRKDALPGMAQTESAVTWGAAQAPHREPAGRRVRTGGGRGGTCRDVDPCFEFSAPYIEGIEDETAGVL